MRQAGVGATPEQTIRSYVDQNGPVEIPGHNLLTTWELEAFDPASRERISTALAREGVWTEPPLDEVEGYTMVKVHVGPATTPRNGWPEAATPLWGDSPLPKHGNLLAAAALACGLAALALGFVPVLVLPAAGLGLTAAFLGLAARRRAVRNPHLRGEALATCGAALGVVAFAIGTVSWVIEHDVFTNTEPDRPLAESGGPTPAATSKGKTVAMGQALRFPNQWTVTVTGARRSSELLPRYQFGEDVKPRGVFVILELTVINETRLETPFEESLIDLVDRDGRAHSASAGAGDYQLGNLADALPEADLAPDKPQTGRLAFDVPRGAEIEKARVMDTLDPFASEGAPDSFVELRVAPAPGR